MKLAREAYSLYVEPASEGAALPQIGLCQQPARRARRLGELVVVGSTEFSYPISTDERDGPDAEGRVT